MKTKRESTLLESNRVGNHRVARRGANSFADAIADSYRQHLVPVSGEGEKRSHHGRERITTHDQKLSFAKSIAQVPGKQLQETRDRFGQSFDYSNRAGGCAESRARKIGSSG
jgi:hypothetical protein